MPHAHVAADEEREAAEHSLLAHVGGTSKHGPDALCRPPEGGTTPGSKSRWDRSRVSAHSCSYIVPLLAISELRRVGAATSVAVQSSPARVRPPSPALRRGVARSAAIGKPSQIW